MSWLPTLLPPTSVPAGLERESQLLHHFECTEIDPTLRAYTRRNTLYDPLSVRGGNGWAGSSDGRFYRAPADFARIEWFDLDGDGVLETPHLVVEDSEANLVQHSDVLTSWTANFTVSTSVGHAVGEADTRLVSDTDATNASYLSKVLTTFTGAGAKGVLAVCGRGPSPAASGGWIRVRDNTAGADRLNATITFNANGVPTITIVSATGVSLGKRYLCTLGGVKYYALFLQTNSVTAANPHEVRLGAAVNGSQQGNIYWGAITVTNEPTTASWIDRPSTGAITRAREVIGWRAPYVTPGAQTWLLDLLEVGALQVSGALVAALTDAAGANPSLRVEVSGGNRYQVTHHNGSSSVSSAAAAAPAFLDGVRLLVTLFDDGSVQLGQSINGGAMAFATRSAALAINGLWGASTSTNGFFLQPLTTLSKARTRLQRWKAAGAVLTEAQLVNRW